MFSEKINNEDANRKKTPYLVITYLLVLEGIKYNKVSGINIKNKQYLRLKIKKNENNIVTIFRL